MLLELMLLLELLLLELLLLELLLLGLLLLGLLLLETDHEERELPRRSVRLGARTAQPSTHVACSLPYSAVFSKRPLRTVFYVF